MKRERDRYYLLHLQEWSQLPSAEDEESTIRQTWLERDPVEINKECEKLQSMWGLDEGRAREPSRQPKPRLLNPRVSQTRQVKHFPFYYLSSKLTTVWVRSQTLKLPIKWCFQLLQKRHYGSMHMDLSLYLLVRPILSKAAKYSQSQNVDFLSISWRQEAWETKENVTEYWKTGITKSWNKDPKSNWYTRKPHRGGGGVSLTTKALHKTQVCFLLLQHTKSTWAW